MPDDGKGRRPSWSLLAPMYWTADLARGGVGRIANTLSPFAWLNFMFGWLSEITPVRLKRLISIVGNALHHITDLAQVRPRHRQCSSSARASCSKSCDGCSIAFVDPKLNADHAITWHPPNSSSPPPNASSVSPCFRSQTDPGVRLGYSGRNVVDSLVETIAAPQGRQLVLEGVSPGEFATRGDSSWRGWKV
jgi:hypothetical protein